VSLAEMLRIIKEEEPPRPSTRLSESKESLPTLAAQRRTEPGRLMKELRGELDWIVMKCLEKDRTRRYETADALARDIERYLADEPVEAGPPSALYRTRKFARKNRMALAVVGAFLFLMGAGATVSTWQAIRATTAEASALRSEAQAIDERDLKEQARQEAEDRAREAHAASEAERQANLLANKRLAQIQKANDLLATIFHDLNPRDLNRRDEEENEPNLREQLGRRLEEAAAQLNAKGIEDSSTVAQLQETLGTALHNLGRNAPALALLSQAYETRKNELGPDDLRTLGIMENLPHLYLNAGQPNKARQMAEEGVARSKARFGPEHPATLSSIGTLALINRDTGKPNEAVRLLSEVLDIQKARQPQDEIALLICMHNLGNSLKAAGQVDKSIPLFEETLARRKIKHGPDHFATLRTMAALGDAYCRTNRLDQGLPLLELVVSRQEAKLGLAHPDTQNGVTRLVKAYVSAGRLDKAAALNEKYLEKQKEMHGLDDPKTLDSMYYLAILYRNDGRFEKAAPLFDQVLEKIKQGQAANQPVPTAYQKRFESLRTMAGAEDRYRTLVQERGPGDPATLEAWNKYAWTLNLIARPADAALEYRRLLVIASKAFREGNKQAEQYAIDYCQFAMNTGYADKEATDCARGILGESDPRFGKIASVQSARGLILLKAGSCPRKTKGRTESSRALNIARSTPARSLPNRVAPVARPFFFSYLCENLVQEFGRTSHFLNYKTPIRDDLPMDSDLRGIARAIGGIQPLRNRVLSGRYLGASTVMAMMTGAVISAPLMNSIFSILSARSGLTAR
jgi:hypothetical protein